MYTGIVFIPLEGSKDVTNDAFNEIEEHIITKYQLVTK